METISELLSTLVSSVGKSLAKAFRKDIIDFITSDEFFPRMG